jgi:hypothetical protein
METLRDAGTRPANTGTLQQNLLVIIECRCHAGLMSDELTPDAANNAIEHAAEAARSAQRRGWRWVHVYLWGWAAASIGLVLILGLGNTTGKIIGFAGWGALVAIGMAYRFRQGVLPVGAPHRIGRAAGLWAATYAVILAVSVGQSGGIWFWVGAALFSAIPLAAAALIPMPTPQR